MASRMASGTLSWTSPAATAKARMNCSSSGNLRVLEVGVHAGALIENHVVDCVVDATLRCPTRELADAARVRLPASELLEALVVGLGVRDKVDVRARPGAGDHTARKPHDRDLGVVADVEHPADGPVAIEQAHQGLDGVIHVPEAARLRPVA